MAATALTVIQQAAALHVAAAAARHVAAAAARHAAAAAARHAAAAAARHAAAARVDARQPARSLHRRAPRLALRLVHLSHLRCRPRPRAAAHRRRPRSLRASAAAKSAQLAASWACAPDEEHRQIEKAHLLKIIV